MNSLIDVAFSRSRVIVLCLCFLLVAGVVSYQNIPKESEPDVAIPYIYVSLHHDGIAPLDAERLLVKPMEKELQSIDGIREMRSSASESTAYVLLEFDAGFDSDTALSDVREKVDSARSNLPDATDKPEVHEVNMALFPVLTVSLSGPLSDNSMNKIAVDLKDQLERLPGVMEASIVGQREEVVEIEVDPVLLSTYEIDFATLDNLVNRNNRLITAGSIDSSAGQVILKVPGVIENLDELLAMPVKVEDDNVITIGDLGGVRRTFKDPKEFARIDGQPALTIEISKAPGANIIDTVVSVRSAVESNRASWPSNLRVGFHQDSSEETVMMLSDLENNVLTGVVLVVLIIMTILGSRSSMLVALAIPGSFLTGVLIINALGYTMNVVVLFSLILVTGMLVDGAIIVVELAERNIAGGMNRRQAYAGSAKRMA